MLLNGRVLPSLFEVLGSILRKENNNYNSNNENRINSMGAVAVKQRASPAPKKQE